MKRKITIGFIAIATGVIGYFVGVFREGIRSSEINITRTMRHWDQLADLDRAFLKTIPTVTNNLVSGVYLMEVWFPNQKPIVSELTFEIKDGKLTPLVSESSHRAGFSETFSMSGNVVSWHNEGNLYEANAQHVGLVMGDEICGRVYGWNPGDESIGSWRIHIKRTTSAKQ